MLRIAAAGMISSVGTLVPACAALRANVVRTTAARDFLHFESGDDEAQSITTFEIPYITFGSNGVGRLVVIAVGVLRDLIENNGGDIFSLRPSFFVALPDPWTRGVFRSDVDADDESGRVELFGRLIFKQLSEIFPISSVDVMYFAGGHVAFSNALAAAQHAIENEKCRYAITLAVDSLVAPATLEILADQSRIKTRANSVGFVPGEAGGALLLASGHVTDQKADERLSVMASTVQFGSEENSFDSGKPSNGYVTAQCLYSVWNTLNIPFAKAIIINDHNGEPFRATEWGSAQSQLSSMGMRDVIETSWYPALGFGELGAAYGVVAGCVAYRSIKRNYCAPGVCLISAADDGGDRSAFAFLCST